MEEITWDELKRRRNYTRLAEAIGEIMVLRRKERLKGSKRSIREVLRLADTSRRLIEFYEREGLLIFVLDENNSIREIRWRLHERLKKTSTST